MKIIILLWIAAGINWALQVIDLHTTAENIKHHRAREGNKRLDFLNDAAIVWHTRFWYLVALKAGCVAAVGFLLWAGLTLPNLEYFALACLVLIAVFYWPIMMENLRIYNARKP